MKGETIMTTSTTLAGTGSPTVPAIQALDGAEMALVEGGIAPVILLIGLALLLYATPAY